MREAVMLFVIAGVDRVKPGNDEFHYTRIGINT
jgi:hypothetical protein